MALSFTGTTLQFVSYVPPTQDGNQGKGKKKEAHLAPANRKRSADGDDGDSEWIPATKKARTSKK